MAGLEKRPTHVPLLPDQRLLREEMLGHGVQRHGEVSIHLRPSVDCLDVNRIGPSGAYMRQG